MSLTLLFPHCRTVPGRTKVRVIAGSTTTALLFFARAKSMMVPAAEAAALKSTAGRSSWNKEKKKDPVRDL
jgi:hypothetical protein